MKILKKIGLYYIFRKESIRIDKKLLLKKCYKIKMLFTPVDSLREF